MRKAKVFVNHVFAGNLFEIEKNKDYHFNYFSEYKGDPVSLTMPVNKNGYVFKTFPTFFDGLLPEGIQLEGLLKIKKIDKDDYFSQLIATGADLVGNVTVEEITSVNE